MDEIAALSTYERDDLHRGIRAAMKCEPFDEHEALHWQLGWLLYRDTRPKQDDGLCTVH